jgi:multidrug efflux system membrane fusion protein
VLNQTRPIYVAFSVPGQILPALRRRRGERIPVSARATGGSERPSEGLLTFVDNAVDGSTGTILLKATFDNEGEELWPGEFVDVVVTLGEEPGRVVAPAQAVQAGQQGQYVFVVKDDATVELRPVKVARIDEAEAVIDDGLAADETVVTDGQIRLVQGSRISVKEGANAGGNPS